MYKLVIRLFLFCVLSGQLVACTDSGRDYNYFMMHPDKIQAELEQCATQDNADAISSCVAANQAGQKVNGFIRTMQQNPQLFGQHILTAETRLVHMQQRLNQAKQKLAKMERSGNISHAKEQAIKDEIAKTQEMVYQGKREIQYRLAFIRLLGE